MSDTTVNEIKSRAQSPEPDKVENNLILNESQGDQKFSSEGESPKKSENLLNFMDIEKKPLEGLSCGRNADSEVSLPVNQEKKLSED